MGGNEQQGVPGLWIGPNENYVSTFEYELLMDDVGNEIILPGGNATEHWVFRLTQGNTAIDDFTRSADWQRGHETVVTLEEILPPGTGDSE